MGKVKDCRDGFKEWFNRPADKDANDPLKATWACLTCNSKFELGEVRPGAGAGAYDPMPCPRCGNRTITPADSQIRATDEYYGEVGTKN